MPTSLTLYRNRTTVFRLTFQRGGQTVDLTGATITLTVRRNYTDAAIATLDNGSHGGITITDASQGKATATFDPTDLTDAELPSTPIAGRWEVSVYIPSTGDRWNAAGGDAIILPNVA